MREREVDKYLVSECKRRDILCIKNSGVRVGHSGLPDRMLITPWGDICFVEVKGTGGRMSKLQRRSIEELSGRGVKVAVVFTKQEIDNFLAAWYEEPEKQETEE